ncbi:MAG: Lrp/AsnC family transcriptional regulator [Clostridia bacterium]|nr:Lrp/AsnC family transcriptional regulator [Clostridia bacterium]
MINRIELLRLVEKDAKLTSDRIAVMLDSTVEEVEAELKVLCDEKVILGTKTEINWEKTDLESVVAMIEVRITPVRNKGYNHIASFISKYEKVKACYLMSGGFDLMIIYEDKNLKDVSSFVSDRIAPLDGVLSTTTHFVLKKYKDNGILFEDSSNDDRQAIIL